MSFTSANTDNLFQKSVPGINKNLSVSSTFDFPKLIDTLEIVRNPKNGSFMVCVGSFVRTGNKLIPDNYFISKRAIFSCAAVSDSSFWIWNRQEQNKKNDNDDTDNDAFFHIFSPPQISIYLRNTIPKRDFEKRSVKNFRLGLPESSEKKLTLRFRRTLGQRLSVLPTCQMRSDRFCGGLSGAHRGNDRCGARDGISAGIDMLA